MPMTPFFEMVGQRAFEEMQRVFVPAGGALPPGPYDFLEVYCTDLDCDCRRALIRVARPDDGETVLATLSLGWGAARGRRKRSGDSGDSSLGADAATAKLEPTGTQTTDSPTILKLFQQIVRSDPDYVERLKRHYAEARDPLASEAQERSTEAEEPRRLNPERRPGKHFPREGFTIFPGPGGLEIVADEYHSKPLKLSWRDLIQFRRDAQR